ncbi:uncharacterized protein PV09_04697 [Verruconis gallopava]|uniref:Uncharacterized protein n=1 Tax=Verruconis gallopava TaxID=253628 RepID=A0A0D1YUT3_9PEZI|nr:uncharacterized protein PV09_04697 [Verruconis gallopava]KIW04427.1 hypothetical protein PV09_04697 [Verruconis gallopava]
MTTRPRLEGVLLAKRDDGVSAEPETSAQTMSLGANILVILGALLVVGGMALLMWLLHVRRRKGDFPELDAASMEGSKMDEFEAYRHLKFDEKSLRDLERGLGIDSKPPEPVVLTRR